MVGRQLAACHVSLLFLVLALLAQLAAVAGGPVKRTFLLNTTELTVDQAADACSQYGLVLADVQSVTEQAELDALRRILPGGDAAGMWYVVPI